MSLLMYVGYIERDVLNSYQGFFIAYRRVTVRPSSPKLSNLAGSR